MSNEIITTQEKRIVKLTDTLAEQYGIEPDALVSTLKNNIIHTGRGEPAPTKEELFHVLTVMNKYGLDPWVKQLHAFRHDGRLHVAVGYDGWVSMAQRFRGFLGVAYEYPPVQEMVKTPGGKKCWPWVRAVCQVDGRNPTEVYAFLEEWYISGKSRPSNWDKYPTHRLRMKAYTMAIREALGISLYDDVDWEQMQNDTPSVRVATATEQQEMSVLEELEAESNMKIEPEAIDNEDS